MRRLLFAGPRQIVFEDGPDEPLTPTAMRIRALYNGISHGTEMNFYCGTAPHIQCDIDDGLFRKRDRDENVYPIWHGYETVGEVIEKGSDVADFQLGDIVWTGSPRADRVVCDTTIEGRPFFCERAPDGADPRAGVFLALGGVALDAHLTSGLRLGETAVVSGLGCIGLLCVQMLARAGVKPIIAVDPLAPRRELASRMGADHALDPSDGEVAERIRDLLDGRGCDAAIETSGNWRALHEAVRCCASGYGRVVAVGFYQGGGHDLRLGEEFHHSSFYGVGASSILAVNHRREPAPGRAWDRIRVYHLVAKMLADGRLKTDELLTRVFPFGQAAEAFALIDEHPERVMKVALKFD